MNIPLIGALLLLSLIVCPLLYIYVGPALDAMQLSTLKTIGIIAGCSALLCFALGEITRNNSQVDKIWSILPFVYCWVIAVEFNLSDLFTARFLIFAFNRHFRINVSFIESAFIRVLAVDTANR